MQSQIETFNTKQNQMMMTNIIVIIIIIIIIATIFQIPCVDHGAGEEKAANNTFPRRINIKPLPPKNEIQKGKLET